MYTPTTFVVAFALTLALGADLPDKSRFRMPFPGAPDTKPLSDPSVQPDIFVAVAQHPSNQPADLKPQ